MARKRESAADPAAEEGARAEFAAQEQHRQEQEAARALALDAMEPPPPPPPAAIRWIECEPATGRILVSREMPRDEFSEDLIPDGVLAIETDLHVDPTLAYVADGAVVARPDLPAFDKVEIRADGEDAATLVLPEPMIVAIDGVPHGPTDRIEIVSPMPATYRVTIQHFPFRDFAADIVALPVEPA